MKRKGGQRVESGGVVSIRNSSEVWSSGCCCCCCFAELTPLIEMMMDSSQPEQLLLLLNAVSLAGHTCSQVSLSLSLSLSSLSTHFLVSLCDESICLPATATTTTGINSQAIFIVVFCQIFAQFVLPAAKDIYQADTRRVAVLPVARCQSCCLLLLPNAKCSNSSSSNVNVQRAAC